MGRYARHAARRDKTGVSEVRVEGIVVSRCERSLFGIFSDAMSPAGFASDKPMEECHHEPLALLTGVFERSKLRWPTVDKEGFAIVSTF